MKLLNFLTESFFKYRGLGDCGVILEYQWLADQKRFELFEVREQSQCELDSPEFNSLSPAEQDIYQVDTEIWPVLYQK